MRKIEQQMCLAAGQHRKWKSGNTEVYPADGGFSEVYLHGNHIATVNTSNGSVMPNLATLAKWPTRTTKSRLRALGAL
jgi:hypothetical protein